MVADLVWLKLPPGLSFLTRGDFALRGDVAASGDGWGRRRGRGLPLASAERRSAMLRTSFGAAAVCS